MLFFLRNSIYISIAVGGIWDEEKGKRKEKLKEKE